MKNQTTLGRFLILYQVSGALETTLSDSARHFHAEITEGMEIAVRRPAPSVKGNAQLDGAARLAEKNVGIDLEIAVEIQDRRYRRFANSDGSDRLRFTCCCGKDSVLCLQASKVPENTEVLSCGTCVKVRKVNSGIHYTSICGTFRYCL